VMKSVAQDEHPLSRMRCQPVFPRRVCEQNPRVTYPKLASFALPFAVIGLAVVACMHATETKPECPLVPGQTPTTTAKPTTAPPIVATEGETRVAFEKIYRDADWGKNSGGIGNSGTGSTLEATALYRQYLQDFMKANDIKSVVDAGCGDWEFSQKIDWTGIDYKGYDIVAKVIEADKAKYGKPNIQFFTGNIVEEDLPPADLLISKHVLQHIPNADVKKFLDKQLKKYKHVLLTNGVHEILLTGNNADIKPGEYRLLELMKPPFDIKGRKALTYWANGHMHQVLHINNEKPPAPAKK
jgi:SAM-dependent methyltransferase